MFTKAEARAIKRLLDQACAYDERSIFHVRPYMSQDLLRAQQKIVSEAAAKLTAEEWKR